MTRRRQQPSDEGRTGQPRLTISRSEFEAELDERIAIGREITERGISSQEDLDAARADYYTWDEYNTTLLNQRFTTIEIAEDYGLGRAVVLYYDTFQEKVADLRSDIRRKVRKLASIKERLLLFEEPSALPVAVARRSAVAARGGTTIFIVHGRAEATKLAVHGLLREATSLDPVILHDKPNKGRTIIEKFEDYAEDAAFAVVVLTPDDVGRLADEKSELSPRARQNVVFEFGFFVGALGRNRVAIVYGEEVELPSDVDGLLYIPFDEGGGWKLLLAKELKAAGIPIQAEKLL